MPSLPDKRIVTQPVLDVVLVLRRCRACDQSKPLEHFLLYRGAWRRDAVVTGDVKVCAACRGHKHPYIRTTPPPTDPDRAAGWPVPPRMLGRYLDLPLDDWAELTA